MNVVSYTLSEHRHRFAVWAAARASQRGFTKVQKLRKALEKSGIREVLAAPETRHLSAAEFDSLHRKWCSSIRLTLIEDGADKESATFGRAAKLVAVYLKAIVIMSSDYDSSLGRNLHPPIDRILLQALAKSDRIKSAHQAEWGLINWTDLNESRYTNLIHQLRGVLPPNAPFWTIEEYWEPSKVGR